MRDSSGFDAFYAASSRRIAGQVYAMTGDLGDAEEAVQEAFARAWQRWEHVSGCDDAEAWVRTVAWRIAISRWRKAVNRARAYRRHGAQPNTPAHSPDRVALVNALRRIPAEQRRAIVLHHLAGFSVEEVAREVRAPVSTVKSRLARGRRALAGHLSELADEAPEQSSEGGRP